jgi:hypothetical protein
MKRYHQNVVFIKKLIKIGDLIKEILKLICMSSQSQINKQRGVPNLCHFNKSSTPISTPPSLNPPKKKNKFSKNFFLIKLCETETHSNEQLKTWRQKKKILMRHFLITFFFYCSAFIPFSNESRKQKILKKTIRKKN